MELIKNLHEIAFYAMYVTTAIAVYIVVERSIFYMYTIRHVATLENLISSSTGLANQNFKQELEKKSVPATVIKQYLMNVPQLTERAAQEDLTQAIYIANKSAVSAKLWALNTVITAAPLLGLVGTILGIIDTFAVLAASGISDTAGVSKGIGTALYATAIGISIALFGVIFFNYFSELAERINDSLKALLLRAGLLTKNDVSAHEVARIVGEHQPIN